MACTQRGAESVVVVQPCEIEKRIERLVPRVHARTRMRIARRLRRTRCEHPLESAVRPNQFLGEVWVNEKGLAASTSANPSSFMVAGARFGRGASGPGAAVIEFSFRAEA